MPLPKTATAGWQKTGMVETGRKMFRNWNTLPEKCLGFVYFEVACSVLSGKALQRKLVIKRKYERDRREEKRWRGERYDSNYFLFSFSGCSDYLQF